MSELALAQARSGADLVRSRATAGASDLGRSVSRASRTAGTGTRTGLAAVQTRLLVGASHDPFEHEAERTADAVTEGRSPSLPSSFGVLRLAQRAVAKDEPPRKDDDREKQAQKLPAGSGGPGVAPAGIEAGILGQLGRGLPLDPSLRTVFEPCFGYDLSRVRVHTGPAAADAASALGARAFTVGQDVFFGRRVPADQPRGTAPDRPRTHAHHPADAVGRPPVAVAAHGEDGAALGGTARQDPREDRGLPQPGLPAVGSDHADHRPRPGSRPSGEGVEPGTGSTPR